MPSRPLTRHEQQMARRLRDLWEEKKAQDRLTQDDVNRQVGWSPSVFSQYLRGRIPLNTDAILRIAKAIRVQPWDIDPTLEPLLRGAGYATFDEAFESLSDSEVIAVATQLARRLDVDGQIDLVARLAAALQASRGES